MSKYKIKNPGYIVGKGKSSIIRSKAVGSSNIPYCQNIAIDINAPKCSEDCCNYGSCNKQTYFEHIANKYNTTVDKIDTATKFQFDKFVIEDREYSNEEVYEILKKHKEEEDKKYRHCFKCKIKYLNNDKINMVKHHLHESIINDAAYAHGYADTPYIKGFKILSTCGKGKDIELCDNCIEELIDWLGEYNHE